jgi:hypothetical protein
MSKAYEEILEHIEGIGVIDTHEHLPPREDLREGDTDVLKEYLSVYFNRDLISSGLPWEAYQKVINHEFPLMERWEIVEPYWENCRMTGYGKALDLTAQGLYGIDGIRRGSIEELNEAFLSSLQPGHFRRVLKDKCRLKICLLDKRLPLRDLPYEAEILDSGVEVDRELFRCVYRLDRFVNPTNVNHIRWVEKLTARTVCCIDDWLEACELLLDRALSLGCIALKSGLAYHRSLQFERVNKAEAEAEFLQMFKVWHLPDWIERGFIMGKTFQDYMMHFILQLAEKRGLVFQIHTGIMEGSGNLIHHADPSLLSNLFLQYPSVKFDIFHMGYPFQNMLSVLAKSFPNVFINMCWAHAVSPAASIQALVEWVDTVPLNKISAFGGDLSFVDGVYGALHLSQRNVSMALAQKVAEGFLDLGGAKRLSEMFFHDNPLKLLQLEGKL